MIQTQKIFVAISFKFNGQNYTVYGAAIDAVPYVAGNTEKKVIEEYSTKEGLKKNILSKQAQNNNKIKLIDATQWTTGKKLFKIA